MLLLGQSLNGPCCVSVSILAGGWLGFVIEGVNDPLLSTSVPKAEQQEPGEVASFNLFLPLKMIGLIERVCTVPCPKREVCQFEHKDFVLPWKGSIDVWRALAAWPRHREAFF